MAQRNPGIELFRCLLVYGICVYHAFFLGGYANGFESRMWTWCVPGFAFISGFFGVKFRPSKVIRLYVMASICFILPMILGGKFCSLLQGCWYLHAYAILLFLSPVLNPGLDKVVDERKWIMLLGIVAIGLWSWLSEFAPVRAFIPKPAGIGALTFVSVLVAYVMGAVYRKCPEIQQKINRWWLLIVVPLMPFTGHYTSPVTLVFVVVLFAVFSKLQFGHKMGKCIELVAASGFAVYVLHANWQVLPIMHNISRYLIEECHLHRYLGLMMSSAAIWIGGVVAYLTARIIFYANHGVL